MKRIILFLLVLIQSSLIGLGCSCEWAGGFLDVSPSSEVIVLAKVVSFLHEENMPSISEKPVAMAAEIEILEVLQGKETRKRVKVFGDNGQLCRPYIQDAFQLNQYYVIALDKTSSNQWVYKSETVDDYALSGCGQYWIPFNPITKKVSGVIGGESKTGELNYQEFKVRLRAKNKKKKK